MILWPPLTGTKLSTVAPRRWAIPSGYTPGNHHDRQAKPDNPRTNRLERRTVLFARKLACYKADIAALSKTRLSKQGQLEEVGAGYAFFWSGWSKVERRDAAVAFAIRNDIMRHLLCLPQGINDHLISLRRPLWGRGAGSCWTIFSSGGKIQRICFNQITQKLEYLHTADEKHSVETRWCQLRNVIEFTALEVLGRARRQHQDWFDDNDADISNLLAEKNRLHKA
ncbi:unnamed protein product [Schistocephalus solidus]|uniref:Uncharacterized protein n=1 Tax=Schistocephalus solidus TaxID=70667 RepID=A0A183T1B3_SCHSO|nr:unnamed protein product [Schistocephalus solidus]